MAASPESIASSDACQKPSIFPPSYCWWTLVQPCGGSDVVRLVNSNGTCLPPLESGWK
jgi:hypothetical protein